MKRLASRGPRKPATRRPRRRAAPCGSAAAAAGAAGARRPPRRARVGTHARVGNFLRRAQEHGLLVWVPRRARHSRQWRRGACPCRSRRTGCPSRGASRAGVEVVDLDERRGLHGGAASQLSPNAGKPKSNRRRPTPHASRGGVRGIPRGSVRRALAAEGQGASSFFASPSQKALQRASNGPPLLAPFEPAYAVWKARSVVLQPLVQECSS